MDEETTGGEVKLTNEQRIQKMLDQCPKALKVSCKCGVNIDVEGAMNSKRKRIVPTHYAVRCKKCGRWRPMIEAKKVLI